MFTTAARCHPMLTRLFWSFSYILIFIFSYFGLFTLSVYYVIPYVLLRSFAIINVNIQPRKWKKLGKSSEWKGLPKHLSSTVDSIYIHTYLVHTLTHRLNEVKWNENIAGGQCLGAAGQSLPWHHTSTDAPIHSFHSQLNVWLQINKNI